MMLKCVKCKKYYGKNFKSSEIHNNGLCEKCIKESKK
jgi:hypothetical protein